MSRLPVFHFGSPRTKTVPIGSADPVTKNRTGGMDPDSGVPKVGLVVAYRTVPPFV
jgi:hypothetical protein